ncbi:MAG: hypothetical protein DMF61_03620 [Blastocatellia bacterium AA13]|nr:MAG: hypothetical protein DMF61_03620 [Blastocatellia bacterium AA13]
MERVKCDSESERSRIAQDILAYLSENPDAEDTLPGIVEWWLLAEHVKRRTEAVKEAIAGLVQDGLIIENTGLDLQAHYKINAEKTAEIMALVDTDSSDSDEDIH